MNVKKRQHIKDEIIRGLRERIRLAQMNAWVRKGVRLQPHEVVKMIEEELEFSIARTKTERSKYSMTELKERIDIALEVVAEFRAVV